MSSSSPTSLEKLLLSQIESLLGLVNDELVDNETVIEAIGTVLGEGALSSAEQALVRQGSLADGAGTGHSLLSLRVERALSVGLKTAAEVTGKTPTEPPPRVVTLGTESGLGGADAAKTQPSDVTQAIAHTLQITDLAREDVDTEGASGEDTDSSYRQTLLIADGETLARLEDRTLAIESDPGSEGLRTAEVPDGLVGLQSRLESLANETARQLDQEIAVGHTLRGKYRIEKLIGKGGFGAVYKAVDTTLGSLVAIKVLNTAGTGRADREAFKEEAKRVTRLKHPNIVDWKVFEERADGSYYFVMEYLEGEELADILQREKRLAPLRVTKILLQVLSALRSAHNISEHEAILHLDLKPQNVFIVKGRSGQEESVKVIDFGLGLISGNDDDGGLLANEEFGTPRTDVSPGATLQLDPTTSSTTTGRSARFRRSKSCTPAFASPEQAAHFGDQLKARGIFLEKRELVDLDGRSDLYSLGVMGYLLLTGKFPFREKPSNVWDWIRLNADVAPVKLSSRGIKGVSRPFARFIDRCLLKDRDKRWTDTNEAYQTLYNIVHPPVWKTVAKFTVPVILLAALAMYISVTRGQAQRFDLRAVIRGTEIDVDGATLFLGPEASTLSLIPIDAPSAANRGSIRVVGKPEKGAESVPGLSARWVEGESIELLAGSEARGYRGLVHLELEKEGRDRFSRSFEVVHLPLDAWEILPITVDQLGGRLLDPSGRTLEIKVRSEGPTDIEAVRVEAGDASIAASFVDRRDQHNFYVVPLGSLELERGDIELRVLVQDRARRAAERIERFSIEDRPIRITRSALKTSSRTLVPVGDGVYYLFANTGAQLEVALNRTADLTWRIVNEETEAELWAGRSEGKETHRIELGRIPELQGNAEVAYRGRIHLEVDDRRYVLRSESARGYSAHQPTRFWYRVDPPELDALTLLLPGQVAQDLDEFGTLYIQGGEVRVGTSRKFRSSMDVGFRYRKDQVESWTVLPRIALQGPINPNEAEFELDMQRDGAYELQGQIFLSGEEGAVGESFEESPIFSVIVDSSSPRLALGGFAQGRVLTQPDQDLKGVTIALVDEPPAPGVPLTPVSLTWSLARVDASDDLVPQPVSIPWTELTNADPKSFSVPLALSDRKRGELDGFYKLTAAGVDRAGNQAVIGSLEWEVALDGPECDFLEPNPTSYLWERTSGDKWMIRVRSTDNNGTARVRCTVAARKRGVGIPKPLVVELERKETDWTTRSIWEAEIRLRSVWAQLEVELRLEAEDRHGRVESGAVNGARLPDIRPNHPNIVSVRLEREAGTPVERMRLVRGNRERTYRFHGRGDSIEGEQFDKCGVQLRRRIWSWDIEYERETIEDYYLDENEVSCQEFLAFLRANSGFSNPDNWPLPSSQRLVTPREDRCRELTAQMSAIDGDLPATGVTWEEAFAYANWVGKRLPSYVEWEYAVRGGAQYRPYAAFDPKQKRDKRELNFAQRQGGLWVRRRGADRTFDTGIANLDTNAMEWTSTPSHFGLGGQGSVSEKAEARARPLEFAYPHRWKNRDGERCVEYYAVGGHYLSRISDVTKSDLFGRAEAADYLGFRCAISAEEVSRNREGTRSGASSRARFERFTEGD